MQQHEIIEAIADGLKSEKKDESIRLDLFGNVSV